MRQYTSLKKRIYGKRVKLKDIQMYLYEDYRMSLSLAYISTAINKTSTYDCYVTLYERISQALDRRGL